MGDTVIDAHQHVWDLDRADYAWLTDELGPIHRSIGIEEVLPSFRRAGILGSVLVQSADNAEDTATMLRVAERHREVLGVVGWVPLDRPDDAAEMLERRSSLIVGIRALIHDLEDPDWLLRPDVDEGLGVLERAGVPFDVVAVLPRHLELVPILSERHPDLDLVVDHLGHPPLGHPDPHSDPWWRLIAAAAENPRVHAKVSGMYPAGAPTAEGAAQIIRPFVDRAMELFGPGRLMYGGDWPMSLLSTGYDTTWDGLAILFDELDAADREQLVAATCRRFYGLDPDRVADAQSSDA